MTRYGYDAKDRLASVQDPINLATTYTYDGLGNLTQLGVRTRGSRPTCPMRAGNVVGATDARGLATSYAYDALNRQTLATFAGGSVALEYDNTATGGAFAKGRLTKVTDPSGSTTYAYDARGRVLRKTQTVGSGASARNLAVVYRYAAGRMTGVTYPSGRDLSYAFDAQGRVTRRDHGGPGGAERRNVHSVRGGSRLDLGQRADVSALPRPRRPDRVADIGAGHGDLRRRKVGVRL